MNPTKIVLAKPSAEEVLHQITPFVTDIDHEAKFQRLFEERLSVAKVITERAKRDELTPEVLREMTLSNIMTLSALTSLLGLSQEEFFRHVTLVRLKTDPTSVGKSSEWKLDRIVAEMKRNRKFATEIFDLLLNGKHNTELQGRVPPFLIGKLDGARLAHIEDGGIDALIRIGLKGSYDAGKGRPVVLAMESVLKSIPVRYIAGELSIINVPRKWDCIIPNRESPHIFIEVGVFATTARELSEKAMVERLQRDRAKQYYPDAVVVRVLDGVGWIARGKNDLQGVLDASDYIFTQKTLPGLKQVVLNHVPPEYIG